MSRLALGPEGGPGFAHSRLRTDFASGSSNVVEMSLRGAGELQIQASDGETTHATCIRLGSLFAAAPSDEKTGMLR